MRRWANLARAAAAAERWLLPAECVLCQGPLPESAPDQLVCALCRSRWAPLPEPCCPRCGQPRESDLACGLCRDWPDGFRMVRSAVWLSGPARAVVHRLKYDGWWGVAAAMGRAMRDLTPLRPAAALVPVPLGRARRRERGYNQCDFLAQAVAQAAGARVEPHLLGRRRETARQTGLAPEARQANVAGAFEARGRIPARVVLVDDVFTTGATLVAAAAALLEAGAATVDGVTFARARRPLDDDLLALHLTSTRSHRISGS